MRIPEFLNLGGSRYQVEVQDRVNGDDNVFGCVVFDEDKILLKDMQGGQIMEKTFLHEMVHAIHAHMGRVDNPALDEEYVDGFANALYAVIKQNPNLFQED